MNPRSQGKSPRERVSAARSLPVAADGVRVCGAAIELGARRWVLVAAPIENAARPGTYVAPAKREDGTLVALPMPADVALAWLMANPGGAS